MVITEQPLMLKNVIFINRLVGENCKEFNETNDQNQFNYWHNQGLNTTKEEFNQYLSSFDNNEKLPLESHLYVVAEKTSFITVFPIKNNTIVLCVWNYGLQTLI